MLLLFVHSQSDPLGLNAAPMPLEGGMIDTSVESKQRKRRFSEEVPPSGNSVKKPKVGLVLWSKQA